MVCTSASTKNVSVRALGYTGGVLSGAQVAVSIFFRTTSIPNHSTREEWENAYNDVASKSRLASFSGNTIHATGPAPHCQDGASWARTENTLGKLGIARVAEQG